MHKPTSVAKVPRRKSVVKEFPANKLRGDERVQRPLKPVRMKRLIDTLDLDAIGIITVSERKDGSLIVLDGQHRVKALMHHDLGEWVVKCHVYRGLSIEQEAALFRRLNDTSRLRPYEDFEKGLMEGDPECTAISELVRASGACVSDQTRDGNVTCIATLRRVFAMQNGEEQPGTILKLALQTAIAAWGPTTTAMHGFVIEGIARTLKRYLGQIEIPSLVQKLAKYSGGPAALVGSARNLRDTRGGGNLANSIAMIAVDLYNHGRRSKKLQRL